jgi:hypothetical protein
VRRWRATRSSTRAIEHDDGTAKDLFAEAPMSIIARVMGWAIRVAHSPPSATLLAPDQFLELRGTFARRALAGRQSLIARSIAALCAGDAQIVVDDHAALRWPTERFGPIGVGARPRLPGGQRRRRAAQPRAAGDSQDP